MDLSPVLYFNKPRRMRPTEDRVSKLKTVDREKRIVQWVMGEEESVEDSANSVCSSTELSSTSISTFWFEYNEEYEFFITEELADQQEFYETSEELADQEQSYESSDEFEDDLITIVNDYAPYYSSLALAFLADFGPVFEHQALLSRIFDPEESEEEESTTDDHPSWNGLHRDEIFLIDLYDTSLWSGLVWE